LFIAIPRNPVSFFQTFSDRFIIDFWLYFDYVFGFSFFCYRLRSRPIIGIIQFNSVRFGSVSDRFVPDTERDFWLVHKGGRASNGAAFRVRQRISNKQQRKL